MENYKMPKTIRRGFIRKLSNDGRKQKIYITVYENGDSFIRNVVLGELQTAVDARFKVLRKFKDAYLCEKCFALKFSTVEKIREIVFDAVLNNECVIPTE